jgi:hypothetical protein
VSRVTGDVHLVGSVPLSSVEEVLSTCGRAIGAWAASLPDGEVGYRKNWVFTVAQDAYDTSPDLDVVKSGVFTAGERARTDDDVTAKTWQVSVRLGAVSPRLDGLRENALSRFGAPGSPSLRRP